MVPVPAANLWFNQTAAIFSSHSTSDAISTKHVLNTSFSPSVPFNVFIPLITNRRTLVQQQELAFEQLRQQQEQEQKKQKFEQQQTRTQKQCNQKPQTQKRKRKEKGSQHYQNKRKEPQGHQQKQQKERTFRLKRPEEKMS
ncbi:hypothetical protein G6F37_004812 [Rhizopus arrhizus]|nr:hypothetical protein G6F38_005000 [Rhizopus arrhizus]KAG1159522.1 hypothetical protein G6F37_004812 [Rhizopus arrhizus]